MKALGRHVIVELYRCSTAKLDDLECLEQSMILAAQKAGATVINSNFHRFQPWGISGVVVIQESHFAIHTWPEYRFASLDIFTCGDTIDPWLGYHLIKEALQAEYVSAKEVERGVFAELEQVGQRLHEQALVTASVAPRVQQQFDQNMWFTESHEDFAFSLRHSGALLYKKNSPYQEIKVYETAGFGNMLVLDDLIMCTEKDEYIYHEMITHVPLLTHTKAQRVLIVGGGDGGTARELLKHEHVEAVVLVEIDPDVVAAAKQYLPRISSSFNHPKLTVKIADGIQYIHESPAAAFDVIIVDSSDPVGPAEGLFNEAFYQQVYRCLRPGGILVAQNESPLYHSQVFKQSLETHQRIFGSEHVHCYLASIPTYPSGLWSFSYAAKGVHPLKDFDRDRARLFTQEHYLMYYNEDIHTAAFCLPSFVKRMLGLG